MVPGEDSHSPAKILMLSQISSVTFLVARFVARDDNCSNGSRVVAKRNVHAAHCKIIPRWLNTRQVHGSF